MDHKSYLEILKQDLNEMIDSFDIFNAPKIDPKKQDKKFRLDVLILHLHVDYLLTRIIESKFKDSFSNVSNKDKWDMKGHDFIEKLRIVYATGKFNEGFFNTLRTLNTIRNDLVHELIPNFEGQKSRIRSMIIVGDYSEIIMRELYDIEHLIFACWGYINILTEYFWKSVKKEDLKHWMILQPVEVYRDDSDPNITLSQTLPRFVVIEKGGQKPSDSHEDKKETTEG